MSMDEEVPTASDVNIQTLYPGNPMRATPSWVIRRRSVRPPRQLPQLHQLFYRALPWSTQHETFLRSDAPCMMEYRAASSRRVLHAAVSQCTEFVFRLWRVIFGHRRWRARGGASAAGRMQWPASVMETMDDMDKGAWDAKRRTRSIAWGNGGLWKAWLIDPVSAAQQ